MTKSSLYAGYYETRFRIANFPVMAGDSTPRPFRITMEGTNQTHGDSDGRQCEAHRIDYRTGVGAAPCTRHNHRPSREERCSDASGIFGASAKMRRPKSRPATRTRTSIFGTGCGWRDDSGCAPNASTRASVRRSAYSLASASQLSSRAGVTIVALSPAEAGGLRFARNMPLINLRITLRALFANRPEIRTVRSAKPLCRLGGWRAAGYPSKIAHHIVDESNNPLAIERFRSVHIRSAGADCTAGVFDRSFELLLLRFCQRDAVLDRLGLTVFITTMRRGSKTRSAICGPEHGFPFRRRQTCIQPNGPEKFSVTYLHHAACSRFCSGPKTSGRMT